MVYEIFSQGLFPDGVLHYIIGGLIIGIGVSLIYKYTGIKSGASSFFTTTWSYFSKHEYFHDLEFKDSRVWRFVFSMGLVLGALIFTLGFNGARTFTTEVSWIRLVIGGLLVGIGTRLSRGCTSGHGICGVSSFSKASIISTMIFIAVGIITAVVIKSLGIIP
ncbi:MAG: YeeE/YedE family protein [Nanoarchaeota archaeon]|nr:YeeE/YedE family protein [Nanoarchaeota archaeon]